VSGNPRQAVSLAPMHHPLTSLMISSENAHVDHGLKADQERFKRKRDPLEIDNTFQALVKAQGATCI